MTMNLKPPLRYQLRELLVGDAVYLGINLVFILLNFSSIMIWNGTNFYFNGFGLGCIFLFLIYGIVLPRPSFRLSVQLGISRRTTFWSLLLSTVLGIAVLAIIGELLTIMARAATDTAETFFVYFNLYDIIYLNNAVSLTLGQHVLSILVNITVLFLCFTIGLLLTLLFWRLSKLGCVIVGLLLAFLFLGFPPILFSFQGLMGPVLRLLEAVKRTVLLSPWHGMALLFVAIVLLALVSWGLVRRLNIRGTSLK